MKTQQFPQATTSNRRANERRLLWLGLGVTAVVATLAISFYAMWGRNPQARPAQAVLVQPAAIDPAAQGINGYLNAHASVDKTAAIDPAVQGVNGYLNAHRAVETPGAGCGDAERLRLPAGTQRHSSASSRSYGAGCRKSRYRGVSERAPHYPAYVD